MACIDAAEPKSISTDYHGVHAIPYRFATNNRIPQTGSLTNIITRDTIWYLLMAHKLAIPYIIRSHNASLNVISGWISSPEIVCLCAHFIPPLSIQTVFLMRAKQ